jgi:hypothetical protein
MVVGGGSAVVGERFGLRGTHFVVVVPLARWLGRVR